MNPRETLSPLRWHTDIIYDESGNQKTIEVHYPIPVYPVAKELKDESSFSDSDVDPYQRFFEDEPFSSSEDLSEENYYESLKKKN